MRSISSPRPRATFFPYLSTRVAVEKTGGYRKLASIAGVPRQLGRGIAEAMPLAAAQKGLTLKQAYLEEGHPEHEEYSEREVAALKGWSEKQHQKATQYGNYAGDHPQWGMAIDLSRCTGCQACVTACYAENNIPTVGEAEILRGREMTWMRIERYWEGGEDAGRAGVGAVHPDAVPALRQRAVRAGVPRVCRVPHRRRPQRSGLQPLRRHPLLRQQLSVQGPVLQLVQVQPEAWPEPLNLQLNPDVTVRARGVMEKCTFCVQRIRGAQNQARLEDRPVRDGEFTTACAQACPSDAIVFGDVARSRRAGWPASKQDPRGYHVLEEINMRPAITYLAKVLHPVGGVTMAASRTPRRTHELAR